MSLRKRIRKQRKKTIEESHRPVPGLLGLWISDDPDAADVLFRVHKAVVGEIRGKNWLKMNVVTMYAEIVRYDTVAGYTPLDCAPRSLKQHLPCKETYMTEVQLVFGKKKTSGKSVADFTTIVIRGQIKYAI